VDEEFISGDGDDAWGRDGDEPGTGGGIRGLANCADEEEEEEEEKVSEREDFSARVVYGIVCLGDFFRVTKMMRKMARSRPRNR